MTGLPSFSLRIADDGNVYRPSIFFTSAATVAPL